MNQPDWNERYTGDQFVYGTEPNAFLAEHAGLLTGPVLSLAEGEGRNAVYLASLGLAVHGVDGSRVGLAKAQSLARSRGVEIQTEVVDLADFLPAANAFGSVISISAHLPSAIRNRLYPLVEDCLRSGGIFLLEAYSENQLARATGGPKDPDMLMTVAKIERELPRCEPILLREIEREVVEGALHTGLASVVQFIGRKKG
jgi:SAM-dependent methyltransferase